MTDTIFAPATPPGVSGVAVVRISGPKSLKSLQSLTGRSLVPRVADLRVLRSANGTKIDEALVLFFPGPASFTGEDVVELQCHGSLAILALIGKELVAMGLRPAEAGEFARRAWRNGKLDLIGVEALDTLVHAKDEANLRLAQGQSGRKRQEIFQHWRTTLTSLMAGAEALIDFPEDDLPTELLEKNASALSALTTDVEILLRNSEAAQVLDQGIDILLVGRPNVGKSTLLNAIAGYERAIVTPIAGTTRDFVEVEVSLGRFQVRFVDTAGLHDTEDEVESLGVSRTLARLDSAALVLSLFEVGHSPAELQTVSEVWTLRTKGFSAEMRSIAAGEPDIPGVQALLLDLEDWCEQQFGSVLEQVAFQKQRQVFHVKHMAQSLREAEFAPLPELQAEKLRQAAQAMAALEGRIDVEDVLDQLFAGFCIGK